jgi:predicted small lipoprotein YifL
MFAVYGRKLMSKTLGTFMILIALALSMTACGNKTPSEKARAAGEAVGDAAKATGDAVGDAVQATGEFLNQPKDVDVKAAQERLDGIEQSWQALLAKAAPTTDEAKVELQNASDQMDKALATAKAKLEEAREASDEDWQRNVKPALDTALQESQRLYEDVYAMFGNG